ncbi:hypothetical protein [Nocardioides sp. SYSU D00038]|uniref:hypothetical protein n=1 Tax=Nocardioides sp. SYSU D00038 TaxID=2812554 RepID=UPI0019677FE1|nr:hypothetical protein [Nocardioides sp. SYSU D00038]
MRRVLVTLTVAVLTLAAATACGDDEPAPPAGGDGGTAETKTIEITFDQGTVTPSGERVEVAVGQPIELVVTADVAGELHVHSTPEQELAYGAGTSTLPLTIDQPGVVEVESHDLDQVVVQLEVS